MVRLFHPLLNLLNLLNPLNLLNLFTKSSVTHFPQQKDHS